MRSVIVYYKENSLLESLNCRLCSHAVFFFNVSELVWISTLGREERGKGKVSK